MHDCDIVIARRYGVNNYTHVIRCGVSRGRNQLMVLVFARSLFPLLDFPYLLKNCTAGNFIVGNEYICEENGL